MAFLKVGRQGMDSPQGPTGHFSSAETGQKAGGAKRASSKGKKGLVCSPMSGKGIAHRSMSGRSGRY